MYSIHTRSMETRYHHHHGHNIPHCGGEGVLNTANSKANDRTLMQFMSLSPSILGVCRRSKYARWRDTIDKDDPWIWGLDSMFKASAAPDYVYPTAAMVRNCVRWLAVGCFSFQHNYLSVSVKKGIFFLLSDFFHSELECPFDDRTDLIRRVNCTCQAGLGFTTAQT